jgi:hypothetical protein
MSVPFSLTARVEVEQDLIGPDVGSFRGALLGVEAPGSFFQTDVRIGGEERVNDVVTTYTLLGIDNPKVKGTSKIVVQVLESRATDSTHVGTICSLGKSTELVCTKTRSRIVGRRPTNAASRVVVSDAGDVSFSGL